MTVDSNLVPIDPEDSFLLAVEQLAAGEALESVLSRFPIEERDALRELLTIVAATYHLQEIDIPRPSAERRAAGKTAFLQAAVAIKTSAAAEEAAAQTAATLSAGITPVVAPSRAAPRVATAQRRGTAVLSLGERIGAWWADLIDGILPTTMRLAPLLAMLAAIWFGAFNAVNAAQAAIPGNPVYPAKTWFYAQKLTLSNPEDRPQIYDTYLSVLKEDNARAGELAAQENAIRRTSAMLLIDSIGRSHIEIGGLQIETSYQKSLASNEMTRMTMNGIPVVGAQAYVEYQIVPDPQGAPGAIILQGISLTIAEEPVIIPTAIPTLVTPTLPPATPAACVVAAPVGWVAYVVPSGSTISGIAQQTGATVPELIRVNCIVNSDLVRAGDTLWIPRAPILILTPTTMPATNPSLEVTLTAISTTQPTPLITVTMPAEGTPALTITATVIATATEGISTSTPETTTTETTITVTATLVPTTTVTATVVPSHTPTATVVLPTATTVMTGTVAVTPEPTAEATVVVPETTPTPPATSEAPTDEATAESEPDATATAAVVTTPESTPTDDSSSDAGESDAVDSASGGDSDSSPAPDSTEPPPTVKPTTAPETTGRSGGLRTGPMPTTTPTLANTSPLRSGG